MKLSLIICSRHSDLPPDLVRNIQDTILSPTADREGEEPLEYETVVIDNTNNRHSIFEAYNEGVRRASGDILCFMHDDVRYATAGWGGKVQELFSRRADVDGCAVVGSTWVKKAPSYTGAGRFRVYNLTTEKGHDEFNARRETPLAVFDGLWFCIRRRCFPTIRFDGRTYKGFHFYDMDTAMQMHAAGYQMVSIPGIDIMHPAAASFNKQFIINAFLFYDKWHGLLPLTSTPADTPTPEEQERMELMAIYTALKLIVARGQFQLVGKYVRMAREVTGKPAIAATIEAVRTHMREKGGAR